ncbi:protein-tyrosine phosphatase family protein [Arcanobacterium ihumii]|uniref:protein-tyrosine phosphatase family protein n=1 Tax=Arcanobacterium ihumii TaxID=2138162 RepID=UPI000F532663|nr:protein-tyrosine phosphatase family protein [Arcanobacterium ihumii]
MKNWQDTDGVVEFPSGRRVRGRSWRASVTQEADVSVVLTTASGKEFSNNGVIGSGETITIDWPDYRLPRRPSQAIQVLRDVWQRSDKELVEITCSGGVGRTGTALAILAIFEGMCSTDAIDFVQEKYNPGSVSEHAQRGFLKDFDSED